jgi:hypothetical protein
MKRIISLVVLAFFITASTGCYGSFALTKKIYKWNGSLGNKFVNSIVFWVFNIIPVYDVCAFIDVVVLNTIEFWMGNNPMAFNSTTDTHKMVESKGKLYDVTIGNQKITITEVKGAEAGKTATIAYREASADWVLVADGQQTVVATCTQKPLNMVNLFYPDGKVVTKQVSLSN